MFGEHDIAVIACNTAHVLLPTLAVAIPARYVSLIDVTVDVCAREGYKRVGIMSTPTTAKQSLYADALLHVGIEPITLDYKAGGRLEILIRGVIAGNTVNSKKLNIIINQLKADGAEAIILGCSELSIIANCSHSDIIDPIAVVASAIMEMDDLR